MDHQRIPSRQEADHFGIENEGYQILKDLALDMHWSWSHSADKIWHQLDPDLWELTHNPWVVLQTVSKDKLEKTLENPDFQAIINELTECNREHDQTRSWFQNEYPDHEKVSIAYFSMEYMLSEALPIYSGGLGNVAGDQLKAASDLGIPIVAVGLLYQQGYFRQSINKDGSQEAFFPYNDPGQLPIRPLRHSNGEWLRLVVDLPEGPLWIRTWEVKIGRVKLYLLDTNDPANSPVHRTVTSELYGGSSDLRIKQEILLGIGGWRLLESLDIRPTVCHLNEGHAAFLVIERAKQFMEQNKTSFAVALDTTRVGNLFTTHTAVAAGFDRFAPTLIEQYLGNYSKKLGISVHDLLALGRLNPDDSQEFFNMAYLAIRGSGFVNGVSRLHGEVSRSIFKPLFPRWPENEVPIESVTNGVHTGSWDSLPADKLWTETCGHGYWHWPIESLEKKFELLSSQKLWEMRKESRSAFIAFIRKRLPRQLAARGFPTERIEQAKTTFDENVLTLGFARRFATYKRPTILLHDPDRLIRILTNTEAPVQIVLAGKAHPADLPGQAMIQQWMHFIEREEVRGHIVFLNDYDMFLTEKMVQGVDVWLNTPRRPWEACGTSGMKVLVNGGLNLSELDGWWAEAYCPEVGWAIGDGKEHSENASWDAAEANAIYDLLENQVIPTFYRRDRYGISEEWVKKMRMSMIHLTPTYSANRAVREYTQRFYLPSSKLVLERAANHGKLGKEINDWKKKIADHWNQIQFSALKISTNNGNYIFDLQVVLEGIEPDCICVELYANEFESLKPLVKKMELVKNQSVKSNFYSYTVTVPKDRPETSFTPRIIPFFPQVAIPLEENHILWQK